MLTCVSVNVFLFCVFICCYQITSRSVCKGLVANYGDGGGEGGYETGGGGAWHVKFYPHEKGSEKSLSHAEGVAQQILG